MRRTDEMTPSFALERDSDGVATLIFDSPADPVNAMSEKVAHELERLLDTLSADRKVRALVVASGKPDTFAAGADLGMLEAVTTPDEGERLSRMAQGAFARMAKLGIPTLAAIHGTCVGGGLEWALSCDWRIAADDRKTVLGMPEVKLGLIPGAGGTQRLPRLVGAAAALELILTGKNVRPKKALKMGLVDEVVPAPSLLSIAKRRALELADGKATREEKGSPAQFISKLFGANVWADNPVGRAAIFARARKEVAAASRHYPAPLKAIEAVERGLDKGMEAGFDQEAKSFGELTVSPVARNLIKLFFAQSELKRETGVDRGVEPRPVNKIGILGAGLMGSGIACVTANAGIACRLKDRDDLAVGKGLKAVRSHYDGLVERRSMTVLERDAVLARVTGTTDLSGFKSADVVIEAVFEDLALKQQMLRELEAIAKPDQIFASNTSSIPIAQIAAASARPWNVLGMHYFSPVPKMPLLEVIATRKTAPEAVATAVALGKKQGKTVIVVNDGPGFYTSRILAPYVNEAARLFAEGVEAEAIDLALKRFGFPVGPMTLLDEVGLDVGAKVSHILKDAFGERMEAPASLDAFVREGRLGRKTRKGFFRYDPRTGKRLEGIDPSLYESLGGRPPRKTMAPEAIVDRVLLAMVNEAFRCLGDGILRSTRDGDIGAVFGLGFPPFLGGPFQYVEDVGAAAIRAKLDALADQFGERFTPAPTLVERAKAGKRI